MEPGLYQSWKQETEYGSQQGRKKEPFNQELHQDHYSFQLKMDQNSEETGRTHDHRTSTTQRGRTGNSDWKRTGEITNL